MPVVPTAAVFLSVFRKGRPRPTMGSRCAGCAPMVGRGHMDKNSLSRAGRDRIHRIVWMPKCKRKVLYGEM